MFPKHGSCHLRDWGLFVARWERVCDLMARSKEGAEDSCFSHPPDELGKKKRKKKKGKKGVVTTQGGNYSNKAILE